ncbi:MAG TPA: elongation factor G, partial [Puia sp.]|nr:elongation factor G [Puia sp.]
YHAEVTLKAPKVPYRETIRGKADAQGRHKKQSGGHGQFGDCKIKMEPLPRGGGFEFANEVFGGAIPRQFIPAVEKGIIETSARGFLAGYPVVDFKVTVYDGSYHDVDSDAMSFELCSKSGFREAGPKAKPILLEPIMKVEVLTPDQYMGDVTGDLNRRRGILEGMDSRNNLQVIKAKVPLKEMFGYVTELRSMSSGRATSTMEFSHYAPAPNNIAEEVIARVKGKKVNA